MAAQYETDFAGRLPDSRVLTPNQRIVFFAANLFVIVNWFIIAFACTLIAYDSASDELNSRSKPAVSESDWIEGVLILVVISGIVAGVILTLIAVTKSRLRAYMLERSEG